MFIHVIYSIWTDLFSYERLWSYRMLQTIIMIIQIIYMLLISFKNIMIILLFSTLSIYSAPTTLVLNNSIPYHIYAIYVCNSTKIYIPMLHSYFNSTKIYIPMLKCSISIASDSTKIYIPLLKSAKIYIPPLNYLK